MNRTPIPWVKNPDGSQGFSWNPTTGCTFGCEWCYARKVAARFGGKGSNGEFDGWTGGECYRSTGTNPFPHGFAPTIYPDRLDEPLRRKKPAVIFLGSMGDVFDPAIPDEFRDHVFLTTLVAIQHTFVVLTKRAKAMHDYFTDPDRASAIFLVQPNLVLGVSVTNQADADERIPLLLDTPAAKHMVSVEPMLGPVADYDDEWLHKLDFVVAGAKTPGTPLHEQQLPANCPSGVVFVYYDGYFGEGACVYALRDQCLAAGVPFHYKHGGTNPPLDGVTYDAGVPR